MSHPEPPRRFIQGPVTQTMARPALREEVMNALHHRPEQDIPLFLEVAELQRTLEPRDWGVHSTLQALEEYGLVVLFPAKAGIPARVILTREGAEWPQMRDAQEEPWREEPMRFTYLVDRDLTVGTLADWAKVWERDQYSNDVHLPPTLITWAHRDPGYPVMVDRLSGLHGDEDGYIHYRVWAAGEQVKVRIDGRA